MSRLTASSRSFLILLCLALCVCERVGASHVRSNDLAKRQIPGLPGGTTSGGGAATTTTTTTGNTATNTDTTTQNTNTNTIPATTTQQQQTTQTQTQTTQQQQTTQTTQNTATTDHTTTNGQTTQTTQQTGTTTQPQNTQTTQPNQEQPTDTILSTSTNADGSAVVVTTFVTPPATDSSSSASASATESAASSNGSDSGMSTGSIIGMSVAGGIAVIGVVAFFIWKFTRKRYTDFDDEPIKWPELNAHANDNLNYALPTDRAKTGAGAGLDSASEVNLGRNASVAAHSAYSQPSQYSHTTAADSTADLYAPGGDPYAVPPLPHLNPNQPYRDDPGFAGGGYYDPYRGPVPQTFNDAASISSGQHGGEAIPMNNLGVAQTGRRSPGPQMGLDANRAMSPQPPMAGRQSPGPSIVYAGRTTPGLGPVPASGRHSPGPGVAYGGAPGY